MNTNCNVDNTTLVYRRLTTEMYTYLVVKYNAIRTSAAVAAIAAPWHRKSIRFDRADEVNIFTECVCARVFIFIWAKEQAKTAKRIYIYVYVYGCVCYVFKYTNIVYFCYVPPQKRHRQHNGFVLDCWIVNGDDY